MNDLPALVHAWKEAERAFSLAAGFVVGPVKLAHYARRRRRARRNLVLALASREGEQATVGDLVVYLDPTTRTLATRTEGVLAS